MATVIKNGTIITSDNEFRGDILISDGKIVGIGDIEPKKEDQIIDAEGKYVFPGGVDQHTHFSALCNSGDKDTAGYESTDAVIVGGTTTIVDYAPQDPGKGLLDSIDYRINVRAKNKTCVDFALHAMITDIMDCIFDEVKELPRYGVSSIKCFMAYKDSPLHVDDGTLYKILCNSRDVGVTVFVHGENGELIDRFQRDCVKEGHVEPRYHAVSRPTFVEGEGTARAIYLAKKAQAPLYIAHVTCQDAIDEIVKARANNQRVMGETCTHYLTITRDSLANDDFLEASKFVCSPALRDEQELNNLWSALNEGTLNAIASDHCGIDLEMKKQGLHNFMFIPNGSPGAGDRIHMIWSRGVATGKITKQKFVQLIAINPAKINGLYPQKGDIAIGSDADIVIFDPEYRGTIHWENCPNGVDYNVYEGEPMLGRVETVLLRGNTVVSNAKFVGQYGQGQFVPAKCFAAAYTGL